MNRPWSLQEEENEGKEGTWEQADLRIEASQGPQPWAGKKVEKLQLRCAKINQK